MFRKSPSKRSEEIFSFCCHNYAVLVFLSDAAKMIEMGFTTTFPYLGMRSYAIHYLIGSNESNNAVV